jgi:hypothetical protein
MSARGSTDDDSNGSGAPPCRNVPADLLLRPLPLLALVLLVVNDHVLKAVWPGWVTGKLSDVAGMVFFPLLLISLAELVLAIGGRPWLCGPVLITACAGATAVAFALVKTSPTVAHIYGDVLGWLRYPLRHTWRPVAVTHDLTDLWALPIAWLAWVYAVKASRRRRAA